MIAYKRIIRKCDLKSKKKKSNVETGIWMEGAILVVLLFFSFNYL
jgi:hypothetical protein